MSVFTKLMRHSLFYTFANSIEAFVPFILAPILTRSLDVSAYGYWILFITYATFMRPLVGLTMQDAIRMQFHHLSRERLTLFLHTTFVVMLGTTLIASLIVLIAQNPLSVLLKFPENWLPSLVLAALLFEIFYAMLAVQQFKENRKNYLILQVVQAASSISLMVVFLFAGLGWQGVVLGKILGLLIACLIGYGFLGENRPRGLRFPSRSFYRKTAFFGVLYFPTGMVMAAMFLTDKLLAAHVLGVDATGLYGAAALFASGFWVVILSVLLAWTPWLFKQLASDTPNTYEIRKISTIFFIGLLGGGIILTLISMFAARYLLGENFHTAIPYIPYMMAAMLMQGYFMHNMKFLHARQRVLWMSISSALAFLCNIGLSLLWVQTWRMEGIMLATGVSYLAAFLFSGVLVLTTRHQKNKDTQHV